MAQLYYDDPTTGWTVLAQGPTGPTGPAGPTGPIGVSQDANNAAILGSDGLVYVPQAGGVTGSVVMFVGSAAPPGWHMCDGSAHGSPALEAILGSTNTPDLRNKFIRGAGLTNVGDIGGSDTATLAVANLPSHSHGGISGSESANHTHAGSSGGMSANASHSHGGTSAGDNVDHSHYVPATGSGGFSANHTHAIQINEGSGESADGNYVDSNPNTQSKTYNAGQTHGASNDHSHGTGAYNTGGHNTAHSHGLSLAAASTDHSHSFTTGTANVTHTHTVSSDGLGVAVGILPSYVVMSYIIKK